MDSLEKSFEMLGKEVFALDDINVLSMMREMVLNRE